MVPIRLLLVILFKIVVDRISPIIEFVWLLTKSCFYDFKRHLDCSQLGV